MSFRIEIGLRRGLRDPRGERAARLAREFLRLPVRRIVTRDVYLVADDVSAALQQRVAQEFADPVTARAAVGRLPPPPFDWLIEIGLRPGVTDNVGQTARTVLADVLDRSTSEVGPVFSATQYFVSGEDLRREHAERLARDLLANELIQTVRIYSPEEWRAAPPAAELPLVRDPHQPTVREISLEVSDEELLRISREGILSLSLAEMRAIRDHYRRPDVRAARAQLGLPADRPTDVELECLAQTWSEHCKHKIFAARVFYEETPGRVEMIDSLFDTFIRRATTEIARRRDWLVSVFRDNAGIIRFNERWLVAYKVETHNSPSALDPYGGAITGIVGVNRDPMGTGLGCELLANTWGYCFASPFYEGEVPAGLMHPRRIRDGVHRGVVDGGNQSGIPWARGFERFDERFLGKPLVFCGTVGRLPHVVAGRPAHEKEIRPGDVIVMAGGRIGKDGIHGATFSSEELRHESPAQAVQIGDAFTQRKLYEFLIEARDRGLYRAITDNGAGGLSSSIGEMCTLSGGADLELARAPLKYAGLDPWEILLSEAQERMSLAVPPERLDELLELARRRDVEATALGTFTDSGAFVVRYHGRVVGRLDLEFLHRGCPRMELRARWSPPSVPPPCPLRPGPRNRVLLELLASLNIASKEWSARSYDGEVKGLSVGKPFVGRRSDVPADATVMRIEHGSHEGIVLAEGINPFYSDLDTYAMVASVVDEAVRRAISVGGTLAHLAGLDNFCWPDPVPSATNPDAEYKMAQLVRANRALYDVTTAYGVPCISGKDSMKNDSIRGGRRISIPPTVLFSVIGRIADVRRIVTMDFKRPGDRIAVAGLTRDELGASEFHRWLAARRGTPGAFGGRVPCPEPASALKLYAAMERAIAAGLLHSSHTPTLGGLAIAFAWAAIGGDVGAVVDLAMVPTEAGLGDDARLFSESPARFVLTAPADRAAELEAIFRGVPFAWVGEVTAEPQLRVRGVGGRQIVNLPVAKMRRVWQRTFDRM
ncbi:MAG: AIR synthase-related protein [Kiritimatiellae bacterium]|nr:AIR synthase-related protein [Kiritimatiellia bacterium]